MINNLNMIKLEENMNILFDRTEVEYVKNTILSLIYEYRFEPRKRVRNAGSYYKNNKQYLEEKKLSFKKRQKTSAVWEAVRLFNNINYVCATTTGPRVRNLFTLVEFIDYFELYLEGKKPNGHVHLARINKEDDYRPGNIAWVENRKKGKTLFSDLKNVYVMSYISKYFDVTMERLFDISIRKGYISRYTKLNSFRCLLTRQKANM